MLYRNTTTKQQVLNLQSGKTLYADPHTSYELDAGDETSEEVRGMVFRDKAVLFPDPPAPAPPAVEAPKPKKEAK